MARLVIEVDWEPDISGNGDGTYTVRSLETNHQTSYLDNLEDVKRMIRFYEEEHDSHDTLSYSTTERFREKTGCDSIARFMGWED